MLKKAIIKAIKWHLIQPDTAFFVVLSEKKYLVISEHLIENFVTTDIIYSIGVQK